MAVGIALVLIFVLYPTGSHFVGEGGKSKFRSRPPDAVGLRATFERKAILDPGPYS
jgi:hypothetical protein